VTTVLVSRPPPCTRRERGPRHFGRKLDSGDGGERPRGAGSGAPLARGEGPRLSSELLDRGTLRGSGYLGKNTGVIHESLLLYFAL
jgi:hypothetical protein